MNMRNKIMKANKKIENKSYTENYILSNSLQSNISLIKEIFNDDETLIVRYFENQKNNNIKCCIIFFQEMIDGETINTNIIKPTIESRYLSEENNNIENILSHVIFSNDANKSNDVNKISESILNGNTVLFLEGESKALIISTIGWKTRDIKEPEGEKALRGPREGFTESLMMNISMIRRKLLTPNLKFKFRVLGTQTKTKICLCYIDGIVNNKILNELNKRLDKIDIDGILASNYIQEFINDEPFSPFKTIGSTERPDIVAAKLLEGRIAIIIDGNPVALTLPHIFIELFQANEDYYINFYFASISRLLRILSFIITISLPSLFVALTTFHIETIPTPLAISISAARQDIPFPTTVEAFGLLIVFEILREAGVRMPNQIGQAFSIVGALVLGQAAVDARFVSAPMIIVIALTGITGLAIPKVKGASILLRIILLILSSILGLYGFVFGIIGLMIHLFKMRSFGVPFMLGLMTLKPEDLKDTAIRAPWFYMKYRPKFIATNNLIRQSTGGKKKLKIKRRILLILLLFLLPVILSGCWNYTDIEKYSLVTGFSLDKDKKNNKYIVNAEVLDFRMSGNGSKAVTNIIESKGNTIFDAIRNMINITGKRLYWGHAKIFIISKDIAEEGITQALDLPYRDAEIREEMHVLISNKNTAKEILQNKPITSNLRCFEIDKIVENQKTLANAPIVRVYELINNIEENDVSPVLPLCDIKTSDDKQTVELIGTAVFKSDKLVGSLNTEESKYFLFATNQIDKGLLVEKILHGDQMAKVTLEVFESKTKIKPIYKDGKLSINMNIRVDASIAEIDESKDFIQESGCKSLKQAAEESLKVSIGNTINKVQNKYDADIFGFAKHIKSDIPSAWSDVKDKWDDTFRNMHVNINVEIQLRNSGIDSKTIKKGM